MGDLVTANTGRTYAVLLLHIFIYNFRNHFDCDPVSIKKNAPDLLFTEGLKQENLGHLAEAIIIYQEVFIRINKFKFQGNFRYKVMSKIKVLHTMLEYENTFRTKKAKMAT